MSEEASNSVLSTPAGNQLRRPLVSVIIPTFNRAQDLARALESVSNQSFDDWEVIVVDNHSIDDTDLVVAKYRDDRMRFFKIHNKGVIAVSRNLGLRLARGRYVAFLDSDDWWDAEKLAQSVNALESSADVVYHDAWLVCKSNQAIFYRRAKTWALRDPAAVDLIARGNALVNSTVVVRRDLLVQIGGLCETPEMVAIEDYDIWVRLAEVGARFMRLSSVLTYYWIGGGNNSNPRQLLTNSEAFVKRHYIAFEFALKAPETCWLELARGEAKFHIEDYAGAIQSLLPYVGSKAHWSWQSKALFLLLRALIGAGIASLRAK